MTIMIPEAQLSVLKSQRQPVDYLYACGILHYIYQLIPETTTMCNNETNRDIFRKEPFNLADIWCDRCDGRVKLLASCINDKCLGNQRELPNYLIPPKITILVQHTIFVKIYSYLCNLLYFLYAKCVISVWIYAYCVKCCATFTPNVKLAFEFAHIA